MGGVKDTKIKGMSADGHGYNYVESARCPRILNVCFHHSEEKIKQTDQEETSDILCFFAEHV